MVKILVLALTNYKFTDEKTGEVKEGTNIEYIADRTESSSDFGSKVGYMPLKMQIDDTEIPAIPTIPAYYDVSFAMKSGKDRKAQVSFNNFKFVEDVKFKI